VSALLLTACELPEELTGVKDSPAPAQVDKPAGNQAPIPAPPPKLAHKAGAESLEEMGDASAHGAWRCGECHDTMQDEWSQSRHAQSSKSPLFQAIKKLSGSDACDGCHTPLKELSGAEQHIADEGVTCEVCHRIESAKPNRAAPGFTLREAHDVKFGPFCDANQRYFHKSECRPYFEQSSICGSCHLWHMKTPSGAEIPVYTEFDDWNALKSNKQCQDCHMPGTQRSAAVSEKIRENVPNHSFLGTDGSLRGSGIDLVLNISVKGDKVTAHGTIQNARAGHYLPAGMSGRQLILRLCAASPDKTKTCEELSFERKVVGNDGKRVPFFLAAKVAGDTRLKAKKTRAVELHLTHPGALRITVELVDRRFAPEVAAQMKLDPGETIITSKEFSRSESEPSSWAMKVGK
jgi:Cytochrome c554 and c-prime